MPKCDHILSNVLQNLKLRTRYEGFVFLSESGPATARLSTHHHVELELNLVRRGTVTYVTDGRRYTFRPGELLWLFPAQQHRVVDRSADAQNYVAVFKPSMIARCAQAPAYAPLRRKRVPGGGMIHGLLAPHDFELVRRTIDSLLDGAPDPELLNREAGFGLSRGFRFEHRDPDGLNAGLRHLLLLCWRLQSNLEASPRADPLHPAAVRALDLIATGDGHATLPELATRCGVSPAYLSRLFARQTGVPLARYRNATRLERFWKIHHQPPAKTLAESVYAAGFGSYAQFYKVFREIYGRGPRKALTCGP